MAALNWPVRVLTSTIGKGHPTHPPGTLQTHSVCWAVKEGVICGQGFFVYRTGQTLHTVTMQAAINGLCAHIAQCHQEYFQ